MRIRHKPNALPELKKYNDIVLFNPQELKGKWREFFGNQNPINIELGMGRGQFVTNHALNNKDRNYIGFEKKNEVVIVALRKILDQELTNVAIAPINIIYIEDVFAVGEVDTIYLNFSDPWPKVRHAKRRLTHKFFLEKYKNFLSPEGRVEFKTDNKDLFDFSLLEFESCGFKLQEVTYDLKSLKDPNNITTEYEEKFMEMGIKINRLMAQVK
jgi:tRNA (guanine-N7-)-methyltransferase